MTDDVYYPPSIPPSAYGDFSGIVKFLLTKFLQKTDDMLPAQVISYDRTTNRAAVQPLIPIITTNNQIVQRGAVASIPVFQYGGGGFVLSFPLVPGDLGWIKANDRDISLFLQNLKAAAPNTGRFHSFENSMFFPDTMFRSVVIPSEDAAHVVLQSIDGTQRVAIWPNKVKVTGTVVDVVASTSASITAPTVTVTASTKITLNSPLTEITGAVSATGTYPGAGSIDATFAGKITATDEIKTNLASGISLSTHKHTGVQTGAGTTGGPTP